MPADDWQPTATIETLHRRAELLALVRRFFTENGYWEVETPLLSHDTCVDPWIDPVEVPHPANLSQSLYLQTSPEFAMKRLLAAGADAIFQITRAFRRGEAGPRHNLEFTIVEWYRVGETHAEQMALAEELVRAVSTADLGDISKASKSLPSGDFPRFTYDEAAEAALGTTVLDKTTNDLIAIAADSGITPPASLKATDRDGCLNLLLAERIEPWLARHAACFLYDYPASQAALARIRDDDPTVAERFELYLDGVELCNGYHELTDPKELALRFERNNALRTANGSDALPARSRLLAAMESGLPDCAGVALGFDRLVMWRLGLSDLREAVTFPFDRA